MNISMAKMVSALCTAKNAEIDNTPIGRVLAYMEE